MADPVTSFEFRREPAPEVLDYFRHKGLTPSFHWTDVWQQEHATTFTVAKATSLEVLSTIRAEVDRAIAEGLPYEQFRAALEPRLKELGWWGLQPVTDPATGETVLAQLGSPRRLKLIYDANIRTANAAGQWARIWRTRDLLPFLIYQHTTSAEPREEHWHWADIPVTLRVDDPWWETHFPPNGWNCKCWVIQADEEDARAAGWTPETEAPEADLVEWTNTRTGTTEMIPEGIDPGWASNPGKTRQQIVDAYLDARLGIADPMIRAVALADLGSSWLARKIADGSITDPGVAAPIGHLARSLFPAETKTGPWKGQRLHSGVVWLTPGAVALTAEAKRTVPWAEMPRLIDEGAIVRSIGSRNLATAYRKDGDRYWKVDLSVRRRAEGSPQLEIDIVGQVSETAAKAAIAKARKEHRLLRREHAGMSLFPAAEATLREAGAAAPATPAAPAAEPPATPGSSAAPTPAPTDPPETSGAQSSTDPAPSPSPAAEPPADRKKPRRRKPPASE